LSEQLGGLGIGKPIQTYTVQVFP